MLIRDAETFNTVENNIMFKYGGFVEEEESSNLNTQEGGDHYKIMKIQPVEFIHANKIPFLEACVIKRVCRHKAKNGSEDIRKAIHELNLILEFEYGQT